MKTIANILILLILFVANPVSSQTLTQTVKGKIYDNETQVPLIGTTVVVIGTNPLLGATTDIEGNYKIANVPIGRYNIQIKNMGYEPAMASEIQVTSGKEVVINMGLKQSVTNMKEVTVTANSHKDQPINSMASISARSFTVEETSRYAGGFDDPARLVSSFAGVTVGNLQDNAIIIRGNSPKGVSWRLEGVEIPNPNHFSGGNVAGGGFLTIFSNQLLSNSDFFTGAFPAEYGNALAGVFDMKLRNGNDEKREHTVQAGMMGIDISSEGPFIKGKKATYLFNYRYSTMGLLSKLGIIPAGQVPKYQDLSFKLNFPTQKAGTFSLWGIGAIDNSNEEDELDSTKWEKDWDRMKYSWNLNTGAAGLTNKLIVGKQTFLSTSVAASGIQNKMDQTCLDNNLIRNPYLYLVDNSSKITLSSFVNHKFSSRLTMKTGINYNTLFYKLNLNATINNEPSTFQNFVKEEGNSSFSEFYIQSKYDITEKICINTGINANYFSLNNDYSIDPRFGIKWQFSPHHTISFGYGKHSQLEELKIYLISNNVNGTIEYPNKNLKLSNAQHLILGYDWLINNNIRLKIEPYFQYLYGIPGIPDSSYSLINFKQDWAFRDSLANNSRGRNIGIDFTFERFLNNNYYYLITFSIFDSKYQGDDKVWRNTRFDEGFVFNALFGKEFFMKKNRVLGVNARFNYMGSERESQVEMERSLQQKEVQYDESNPFSVSNPATYYLDFSISYRKNKAKHSSVWAFQLKNALGSPMYEGYSYNYKTGTIQKNETVVILPTLSYKIEF
jgi:hypothetical protein